MAKWYISSQKTHIQATEHHLPYGLTQCYLPPTNAPCYNPSQTGQYSFYLPCTTAAKKQNTKNLPSSHRCN